MRSATENTTFMSCSIIRIDSVRGSVPISSIIRAVSLGDMPDVGSASSTRSGFLGKRHPDSGGGCFPVGQIARQARAIAVKMNTAHQVRGTLGKYLVAADRREEVERMAAPDRQSEPDILDDAEILEQVIALKRAPHAGARVAVGREHGDVPIVQQNAAGAGLELPADLIDKTGFAGAIRSDD